MRKFSLYLITVLFLVAGCRKDDDHIFDKPPEERVAEALARYQSIIAGATDGWVGRLVTGDSSYFSFYFRFNNENRVVMMSDYDLETATTPKESSYRLKQLQQPALIFDTYGYIHILADPDARVNGGEFGRGRVSDFEFAIDSATDNNVMLTGRFNGAKMTLTKASAEERAMWEGGQIADAVNSLDDLNKILEYFRRMSVGGVEYEILLDAFSKKAIISWINGNDTLTVTRGYYIVPGGIEFSDPIVNGSTTIPGFKIVSFNNGTLTMNINVNGVDGTIKGAIRPIKPDREAFNRFRARALASADTYWVTVDGFHVDGVDDYYDVKNMTMGSSVYYYSVYWPDFQPNRDLYAPIFLNTSINRLELLYGVGVQPALRPDGRAWLRSPVALGDFPSSGPGFETSIKFANTTDYWFVQTSTNSFDMVSANNARAWINWFWIFD
jgi:hypothetical protein